MERQRINSLSAMWPLVGVRTCTRL